MEKEGEELTVVASKPNGGGGGKRYACALACVPPRGASSGGHVTRPRDRAPEGLFSSVPTPGDVNLSRATVPRGRWVSGAAVFLLQHLASKTGRDVEKE